METAISLHSILYFKYYILNIYFYCLSILSNINIYEVTVSNRMHYLNLGLFYYQIDYIWDLLKNQHDKSLVDEIDRWLAEIPRFSELKIFTNRIQSRLIANEYHNLMKVIIFVVNNLYDDTEDFVKNKDLTKVYVTWNEMYTISRYEVFKKSDLVKFEVYIWQIIV